ncbi:hypothetical protein Drorol1_Dr00022156 [Drosera rotundifolia]
MGIRVQVRSVYIEERSQHSKGQYFFAYRIRITNNSTRPVQLLRRHWIITDANGKTENVWGIGVIGEQPVILPRTGFEYSSACPLSTPNGRMEGDFEMKYIDKAGAKTLNVAIAPFSLSTLGNVKTSWNPEMTADTITSSYWLTWKVFGCAAWLMVSTLFATFLISRYERSQTSSRGDGRGPGVVYEDEVWRPCLKGMHPVWLLGYRVVSFFLLLVLLIVNAILDGGSTFFYYTQWTFTLVTIYFGLGSVLSMYGCYAQHNKVVGDRADSEMADAGQRSAAYPPQGRNGAKDDLDLNDHHHARRVSAFWGYAFQIIFQINAGAVVLTDGVFWFVIVPFLSTTRNFDLNFFVVNMHSVNIIFLLGDTALNSLQFPWFRIAYFMLWTISYVSFQWVLHACFFIGWPYQFLDLSTSLAPVWYAIAGIMHVPCYGVFILVTKMKSDLLSRYFPESFRDSK